MIIVYIILAWVIIGIASGIIVDYANGDDTYLKDLFAFAGFGLIVIIVALYSLYQGRVKKKINWNKVIIRNSKRTTNSVKILDKN